MKLDIIQTKILIMRGLFIEQNSFLVYQHDEGTRQTSSKVPHLFLSCPLDPGGCFQSYCVYLAVALRIMENLSFMEFSFIKSRAVSVYFLLLGIMFPFLWQREHVLHSFSQISD